MSFGTLFAWSLTAIQLAIAIAVFLAVWFRGPAPTTRRNAFRFGVAWTVLVSAEYWALGPWSFLPFSVETDISVPLYWFMASTHDGGAYSHAFAGGNDAAALSFNTGQVVSLERFLLAALPLWVAQLVHRPLLAGLAFAGMYLLARRGFGAGRPVAAALAAIHPVANESIALFAWSHGLGYALIPLAVYLCVFRAGRRRYWPGVVALAILVAVSATPTHSGLPLLAAVLLATAFAPPRRWPATLLSCAILALAIAANWHESLLAKIQVAPYTFRGVDYVQAAATWSEFFDRLRFSVTHRPAMMLLAATAIAVLARSAPRRLPIPGILILVGVWGGYILNQIPWRDLRLGALAGFNFDYVHYALPTIAGISIAVASRSVAAGAGRRVSTALAGLALGIAVASATALKLRNTATWLADGSMRDLEADRAALASMPWPAPETFRVVSIPYRLSPNLPVAAGLHSLDGGYNLVLRSHARFWAEGVVPGYVDTESGYLFLLRREIDFKCCPNYDFERIADPVFLRVANVRYVLSKVPLAGPALTKVAGPDDVAPPRNTEPVGPRLRGYIDLFLRPPPIFVYRLDDALPRVFPAQGLSLVDDRALMAEVRRLAPERVAVARREDVPAPPPSAGSVRVNGFRLGRDRIEIDVVAAESGLVVVNAAYTPFWSARVDGRPAPVFPVNVVQMAVAVPRGARAVSLAYARPSLWKRAP
ncbi:MAG: hypothetical protein IT564_02890 [Rhodospirillales bacterium]|nr:hypothetical protein [Rhodospirillales bacterium]